MLKEAVFIALNTLPIYKEDQGKLEEKAAQYRDISTGLAQAVEEFRPYWSGSPEQLAAVTITIGYAESGYSLRIQSDGCRSWECDHGRALGLFQMHQDAVSHPVLWKYLPGMDWESVELSTREAVRRVTASRRRCGGLERRGQDWVPMTFSAYRNGHCIGHWRGLDERVRTYQKMLGILLAQRMHNNPET